MMSNYEISGLQPPEAMIDYKVAALLSGQAWLTPVVNGIRTITYSFYEDSVWNGEYYGEETGVREVSETVKTNVRKVLNWLESTLNIDFVEVSETESSIGDIRYMLSNGPSYAYAYEPVDLTEPLAGDIHLNPTYQNANDTNGFEGDAGSHGFSALIHETLHTLGLKHSFEGDTVLPTAEENTANTVMSYTVFGNASAGTAMAYDLAALQHIYGARDAYVGDTTYQFTERIDQFKVNGVNPLPTSLPVRQVLWDSSGVDTLDFSLLAPNSSGYRLDLRSGGWLSTQSDFHGDWYNAGVTIAYNVDIENVINSSSNDLIYANTQSNKFAGYDFGRVVGNDVIFGADSFDTLDLSCYAGNLVTRSTLGNDLVLGLSGYGTITLKDFALGSVPNILYGANVVIPDISISDVTMTEGGRATLKVNLSTAATNPVSVNYATANGTATASFDYTRASGTLTFAPGETEKTISLATVDDTTYEPTENFFVNLSNAQFGNIVDSQGVVTILDNDVAATPKPTLSINNVSLLEGSRVGFFSTFTFTVTVSGTVSEPVSVDFSTQNGTALAGSDYIATSGTLRFTPGGVKTARGSVNVIQDKVAEADETFFVNLSNAVNADIKNGKGLMTIRNDDAGVIQPSNNIPVNTAIASLFSDISNSISMLGNTMQSFGESVDTFNSPSLFGLETSQPWEPLLLS
jgi:serralysin